MNILWHSNAPWGHTGYGNQTNLFAYRLHALPEHHVTISTFWGAQGSPTVVDGVVVLPAGRDPFGNDTLHVDYLQFECDLLITLMDAWVIQAFALGDARWCPWVPIDADPPPPGVLGALSPAYQPIAYSRFGERQLRESGFEPLYVPHGIDTQVFKPLDQHTARQTIGPVDDDVFLVGMVAANKGHPSRKCFDEHVRAFKLFSERHEDVMFYLHTDWTGTNGVAIEPLMEINEVDQSRVARPPFYKYQRGMLGAEYMVNAYNALDVLVNVTRGEGFGLPIMEAQACGVPVIVGDWTAMPELVTDDTGWKVSESTPFYEQETYQQIPSVEAIVDALEEAYQQRGQRREACREWALNYDADLITQQYWVPALAAIEDRIAQEVAREEMVVIQADGTPHEHRWGSVGLWIDNNQFLAVPCLEGQCEWAKIANAERGFYQSGIYRDGIFPYEVDGIPLDLEDADQGGVVKIVKREMIEHYKLDTLDLQPGDVVLDIGAHVGAVSIYLAKKYPGIIVYAYEPVDENVTRLHRNLAANGIRGQVFPYKGALTGDGRGVRVATPNGNSGGATIYEAEGEMVKSYTLGAVLQTHNIDRVALLKMDCEGAEYEILKDHLELLERVDRFAGELHINNVYTQAVAGKLETAIREIVGAENTHIEFSQMVDFDV
jgi:FkbM family methyltransferase